MHTSNVCVQKYPFFSCTLSVIFLVYIFFDLLLYHSPFLICIAILLRCFWSSERPPTATIEATVRERENTTSPTSTVKEEDYVVVNRDSVSEGLYSVQRQKSRRTIVDRNREGKAQAGRKGHDVIPLTTDKNAQLFVKEREGFAFERGESSSTSTGNNLHVVGSETSKPETLLPSDGLDQKMVKSESCSVFSEADNVEESEDDDDEEAIKNNGDQAMEWTEDDQKNLMDLGLSEIERNRRLESLMAKRRARTLFKIQAEKGLMDLDGVVPPCTIAPVFVSRNIPFEVPIGADGNDSLEVPGSAPSILLPTQNPFDLPYDPLEEKPNLMADSFQQEFTAVNQKEMLYCRHESFSLGPFQFDPDHPHQDRRDYRLGNYFNTEKRAFEGYGLPRYKRQSGNQDTLMKQFLSEVGVSKPLNEVILESQTRVSNSETSKMDMELTEESNDESSSSSSSEMTSEAEVSSNIESTQENAGTNILTGSMSTTEEPHYDSSPTSNDKNRMENTMFFSEPRRRIHTPTFSIASDMQVEVSEPGSPSLTVGNMSPSDRDSLSDDVEVARSNSTNFDCKSYDDVRQVMEDVEKLRNIAGSSETMASENQDTTTQLAARSSFEVLSEGTEKSWSLPDESVKEGSVIYDEGDSVTEIIDDIEDHEKDEDEDEDEDGSQILTRQAIEESQQKPAEMRELESTLHNEENSENLDEHQAKDSAQPALKGNLDLKVTEGSEKQTEQEGVTDMSKSTETEDTLTEDRNLYRKEEVSSSDLNQEIDMDVPRSDLEELAKSSTPDEQTPEDTNPIMTQNGNYLLEVSSTHISNASDSETLEEPSSSEKFTDETNIISNTNERVLIIDEAAKEGSETLLSTIVATEFSETHVEAGFELNEGFETGKPAEESSHPEEAACIPNDPPVSENDLDNEKMKSVEESRDEYEELKQYLSDSADVAIDSLKTANCVGIESNDLMENKPDTDQDHSSTIESSINISNSLNTTVEE